MATEGDEIDLETHSFVNIPSVNPSHFYSISGQREGGADSGTSDCSEVYQVFSRQEHAFQYFDFYGEEDERDNVITAKKEKKKSMKIFSLESLREGRRKFIVADMDTFVRKYSSAASHNRHVYEIIREGYPCRLYFDLEFPKNENPAVDGDDLTHRWIQLILWKLYEYFGLCLGFDSVVDLESSTDKKFSRHVTFIIRNDSGASSQMMPSGDFQKTIKLQNNQRKWELLFLNNIEVGKFVFSVVSDMLQDAEYDINGDHNYDQHQNMSGDTDTRTCEPEFKDFWLLKDGKPIFFADLGVYTRNRAFRLFSSCKYGKTAALTMTRDFAGNGVNSLVNHAILDEKKKNDNHKTKDEIGSRRAFMAAILKYTFVLPLDKAPVNNDRNRYEDKCENNSTIEKCSQIEPLQAKNYINMEGYNHHGNVFDEHECSNCKYYAVHSQNGTIFRCNSKNFQNHLVVPHVFHPKLMTQTQENKRTRVSDFSIAKDWQQLKRPRSYTEDDSYIAASNIMPSPFPPLDDFVLACRVRVSAGWAPKGHLTGWRLYTSSKSPMPGVYPDIFKLRYTIAKNRFCENIGRQHKSNGIIVEADLTRGYLSQMCFDPDCRGYRSTPIRIPDVVLPSLEEVEQYRIDMQTIGIETLQSSQENISAPH